MGTKTAIEWCHHTFSPWWGCEKVSAGCANCYAEALDRRFGGKHWSGTHRFFGEKYWREPLKWNEDARRESVRRRVFCASMADVFEDSRDLDAHRDRLFRLVQETPHLDWLLLTKRPENVFDTIPVCYLDNVWIGTSVEDQATADERIPHLLRVPARVRFLSVEPLLSRVDLLLDAQNRLGGIHWVIVGGESGPKARPCDVAWIRSIVRQCKEAGVPCFVKQLGARPIEMVPHNPMHVMSGMLNELGFEECKETVRKLAESCAMIDLRHPKGGDPSEWPEDLRVREVPK